MKKADLFNKRASKYIQTGTSLVPETYETLCAIAEENNISLSEVMRTILDQFVKEWMNDD